MKRGSNILLLMIVLYVAVTGGLVFFMNRQGASVKPTPQPAAEAASTADLTELIKGDASTGETVPEQTVIIQEPADEPEPDAEPESGAEADAGIELSDSGEHFYRFTASHSTMGLRVRKTPSMKGDILDRIMPGATGYVIERGDTWSEIITENGKSRGYSFNEYLTFEEISEVDYKQGLADALGKAADALQTE